MSILKGILHHWNKTTQSYDTIHPETEVAQVTDWHQGIVNTLASTALGGLVNTLTSDSLLAKMIQKVLTATGVKYNMAQNGYICFGSLFGGLIIQWGFVTIPDNRTYVDFTLPVTFTSGALAVVANDVLLATSTTLDTTTPLTWNVGASTNAQIRLITTKTNLSLINTVIIGK